MTVNSQINSGASAGPSRNPLDAARIAALLDEAGESWRNLTVVDATGSTNADLVAKANAGDAATGAVVVANTQTAGRGRVGRTWESPAGGSLSCSVMLRGPDEALGFAPMLVGLALARALRNHTGLQVGLKWPNDVIVDGKKLAGFLSERVGDGVVVGFGVNVGVAAVDLNVPDATSLADHGALPAREDILVAVLQELSVLETRWREASFSAKGAGLLEQYRAACITIGSNVAVDLPDGEQIRGNAQNVDDDLNLLVITTAGARHVSAGDVTHVRTAI
jgi:BirA family biotin operon repressor/biotin-[acetyl-CoA-carboxylase] ligase